MAKEKRLEEIAFDLDGKTFVLGKRDERMVVFERIGKRLSAHDPESGSRIIAAAVRQSGIRVVHQWVDEDSETEYRVAYLRFDDDEPVLQYRDGVDWSHMDLSQSGRILMEGFVKFVDSVVREEDEDR